MVITEEANMSLIGKEGKVIYISDSATHYDNVARLVRLLIIQLDNGRRVPISMKSNLNNLDTDFWSVIVGDTVRFKKGYTSYGEYLTVNIQ